MKLIRAHSLFEVKALDEEKGIIEGIASTPTTDRMGDIVEPKGAQFQLPLPLLWQHDARSPIGHVLEAKVTDAGIYVKAQIMRNVLPEIERAWALIKSGLVRGLSIGFKPIESADIKGTWGQRFTKWDWLELSAVTIPANAEATMQTIKSLDAHYLRAASGHESQGTSTERRSHPPHVAGIATYSKEGKNMGMKERIAAMEAKRAANVAALDAIMEKAEGGTLDDEQRSEYDQLSAEVKDIDADLKRMRDHEKLKAETATPVTPDAGTKEDASIKARRGEAIMRPNANLPKGAGFVRYFCALAQSKGVVASALAVARQWRDSTPEVENVLSFAEKRGGVTGIYAPDGPMTAYKAAVAAGNTTDTNWASPLVQYDNMASEFVELLRPQTIIGKLRLRRVPFNIRFPSQSSGSSMGWVGQGLGKAVSKLQLSTNTLGFAKAAGIVVVTKELAALSSPAALDLVSTDMQKSMIQFLDEEFIDPGVAASANVSPASITNGLTSQNQATGSTLATFEVDWATAITTMIDANVPLGDVVAIMTPYTAMKIGMLRDAGGNIAYANVGVNGGNIGGVPVITSNSVPHSTSAGSIIVFVAQGEIFLADDGGIEIDTSDQASIEMVDNPGGVAASLVSFWQNNLIGVRVERMINWQRRRTAAVTYIDNLHL